MLGGVNMALERGMVLISTQNDNDACVVQERSTWLWAKEIEVWTVVECRLDRTPTCGLFDIRASDVPHLWRRATLEEASTVRALCIAHAEWWGPDSNAWVAKTIPADEQ